MSDTPRGKRLQIYTAQDTEALLRQLAEQYHGGNVSATVATAVDAYLEQLSSRDALIRRAIRELAAAIEPDERYDPADDRRTEQPHLVLAALFGEADARAIGNALAEVWTARHLPGGGGGGDE